MRQGHVAYAQLVEEPQDRERTLDGLSTFDTEQTGDALLVKGSTNVLGRGGHLKDVWIFVDQAIHQIDLFHETDRGVFALMVTRRVNGPELGKRGSHLRVEATC